MVYVILYHYFSVASIRESTKQFVYCLFSASWQYYDRQQQEADITFYCNGMFMGSKLNIALL